MPGTTCCLRACIHGSTPASQVLGYAGTRHHQNAPPEVVANRMTERKHTGTTSVEKGRWGSIVHGSWFCVCMPVLPTLVRTCWIPRSGPKVPRRELLDINVICDGTSATRQARHVNIVLNPGKFKGKHLRLGEEESRPCSQPTCLSWTEWRVLCALLYWVK